MRRNKARGRDGGSDWGKKAGVWGAVDVRVRAPPPRGGRWGGCARCLCGRTGIQGGRVSGRGRGIGQNTCSTWRRMRGNREEMLRGKEEQMFCWILVKGWVNFDGSKLGFKSWFCHLVLLNRLCDFGHI